MLQSTIVRVSSRLVRGEQTSVELSANSDCRIDRKQFRTTVRCNIFWLICLLFSHYSSDETLAAQYQSVSTTAFNAHGISSTSSLDLTGLNVISVNPVQVHNELERIKTQKSFGPDGLHSKRIRELVLIIVAHICDILTSSLETAILPDDWMRANISPIFNGGIKNQSTNYRPVRIWCPTADNGQHQPEKFVLSMKPVHPKKRKPHRRSKEKKKPC